MAQEKPLFIRRTQLSLLLLSAKAFNKGSPSDCNMVDFNIFQDATTIVHLKMSRVAIRNNNHTHELFIKYVPRSQVLAVCVYSMPVRNTCWTDFLTESSLKDTGQSSLPEVLIRKGTDVTPGPHIKRASQLFSSC